MITESSILFSPSNEWVLPTDGLPASTEDDEEGFTSSSSPSFPSSPNNDHPIVAKTISTENEVQVLADFLSTSTIQTSNNNKQRKHYKRKSSTSKNSKGELDDDDVDDGYEASQDESIPSRRRRRSRRCTTASTISDVTPLLSTTPTSGAVRPRACKSFSGVSTTSFNPRTRLPLNSSPSPLKRTPMSLASKLRAKFTTGDGSNGDSSSSDGECIGSKNSSIYSSSQSNNALLCNFEESALNGRLEPISSIDGFKLQLGMYFAESECYGYEGIVREGLINIFQLYPVTFQFHIRLFQ